MDLPDVVPMADTYGISDFLAASGAGESTLKNYARYLAKAEEWMGKELLTADKKDVAALKNKLRGMKAGWVYAATVRRFYTKAAEAMAIEAEEEDEEAKVSAKEERRLRGLVAVLKLPVRRTEALAPEDILSPAEIQAIIEKAASVRDRALIGALWETGVRVHELLALKCGNVREKVSTENGGRKVYRLTFRKAKKRGLEHLGWIIETAPLFEAWVKDHPHWADGEPLFPTYPERSDGEEPLKPLKPLDGYRLVRRAAVRAGLTKIDRKGHTTGGKRIYAHLFRHSRATFLKRKKVPDDEIKMLLGWSKGSTVLNRTYAHLADSDAYNALLELNGLKPPVAVDLGWLEFSEKNLRPVLPMNAPPRKAQPAKDLGDLQARVDEAVAKAVRGLLEKLAAGGLPADAKAVTAFSVSAKVVDEAKGGKGKGAGE